MTGGRARAQAMQRGNQQLKLIERPGTSASAASASADANRASAARGGAVSSAARADTVSSGRRPWLRRAIWALSVLGVLAALTVVVIAFVLPIDAYRAQRVRIESYERTAEQLDVTKARLEAELATAQSPVAVERAARAQQSLVRPGDTQYYLDVDVAAAILLPPNWPLPGLRHLIEP